MSAFWITVIHSRFTGCAVLGPPRPSYLVTTISDEIWPIKNPGLVEVADALLGTYQLCVVRAEIMRDAR
jgi:hypothetical protein